MISVDGKKIDGVFSFSVDVDRNVRPNVVTISGAIQTKVQLEGISTISYGRYVLRDVDIISESYGSEDETVVYGFTAKDYEVNWDIDIAKGVTKRG
jgi:hypothetical protein